MPRYSLTPVHLSVAGDTKQIDAVCSLPTAALHTSSHHTSSHQPYTPAILQPKFNALPGAVNPMIIGARIPEKWKRKCVVGLDVYTAGNNAVPTRSWSSRNTNTLRYIKHKQRFKQRKENSLDRIQNLGQRGSLCWRARAFREMILLDNSLAVCQKGKDVRRTVLSSDVLHCDTARFFPPQFPHAVSQRRHTALQLTALLANQQTLNQTLLALTRPVTSTLYWVTVHTEAWSAEIAQSV
jgi:hypothetical protein